MVGTREGHVAGATSNSFLCSAQTSRTLLLQTPSCASLCLCFTGSYTRCIKQTFYQKTELPATAKHTSRKRPASSGRVKRSRALLLTGSWEWDVGPQQGRIKAGTLHDMSRTPSDFFPASLETGALREDVGPMVFADSSSNACRKSGRKKSHAQNAMALHHGHAVWGRAPTLLRASAALAAQSHGSKVWEKRNQTTCDKSTSQAKQSMKSTTNCFWLDVCTESSRREGNPASVLQS